MTRARALALTSAVVAALGLMGPAGPAGARSTELGAVKKVDDRYMVVLKGAMSSSGFSSSTPTAQVVTAVKAAGGTVASDLSKQIGVLFVKSSNDAFASTLRSTGLVEEVAQDFGVEVYPTAAELGLQPFQGPSGGGPEQTEDILEPLQWDMQQIRAPEAHDVQAGWHAVDVGILDTGIDSTHPDFLDQDGTSNVDCARGRNSIAFLPEGPGVGTPFECSDNQFHGTHVAGTVAAQANGLGVVGVAPNVTLVPVKVCDTTGFCYASAAVDGITYAGDQQFDVINMSFFVDDDEFQESTEFKCMDDPVQRGFRKAVERAMQYARNQGVAPVAALGNSDVDLAHPEDSDPTVDGNQCDVVPAETEGVVGTAALGSQSEKAGYSNWGSGATDVAAPGGNGNNGDCTTTVLSTLPGGLYGCIQGTSMASPHATGVAALIVSQFGTLGSDSDVKLSPTKVEQRLTSTAIDIGLPGYDECFGNGRIDALRAVTHDTSSAYDASAPFCPEYEE
jgi:subtilisin family serine protease